MRNAFPPSANAVAKIVSNEGDGLYTITRQNWRPSTEEYEDAKGGCGPIASEARDFRNRETGAVGQLVRYWTQARLEGGWELVIDSGPDGVFFGKPTEAYTSGATITLDPCDSAGVDNGAPNVTVQAGWTLPTVTGTALSIPVTAIVPFTQAADGNWYVLGQPKKIVTDTGYNTTTHYSLQKIRYDFGLFCTTESDWQNVQDFVNCQGV